MPAALAEALAIPGLWLLVVGAFVSGCVRGFAGFGTALIFVPLAGQVVPPLWVLIILVTMDMAGPLPNLPRALRAGDMAQVAWLSLGAVMASPLGLMVLAQMDPVIFRYLVSIMALLVPVLLLVGLRYRAALNRPVLLGTGAASGFLGGVVGIPGPPVILLYMAGTHGPGLIRANTMVFLFVFDVLLLGILALQGQLGAQPLWLGVAMMLPATLGNLVGGWLFNPAYVRLYRAVAYTIIVAAALSGLPIWG